MGLVVHVPHASVNIPKAYLQGLKLNEKELAEEIIWATDVYCDELFDTGIGVMIVAEQSRLACDVERFRDDHMEVGAHKGNGLLYTYTQRGAPLRDTDVDLRNKALMEIYDPHHERLTAAVDKALKDNGICLIIDGHSFCEDPFVGANLPDFCIGADEYHTTRDLIEISQATLTFKK